jgi:hypothetical protein
MDATIFISGQPAWTSAFHKGFLSGTKLSFFIECNKRGDCQQDLTPPEFYSPCST